MFSIHLSCGVTVAESRYVFQPDCSPNLCKHSVSQAWRRKHGLLLRSMDYYSASNHKLHGAGAHDLFQPLVNGIPLPVRDMVSHPTTPLEAGWCCVCAEKGVADMTARTLCKVRLLSTAGSATLVVGLSGFRSLGIPRFDGCDSLRIPSPLIYNSLSGSRFNVVQQESTALTDGVIYVRLVTRITQRAGLGDGGESISDHGQPGSGCGMLLLSAYHVQIVLYTNPAVVHSHDRRGLNGAEP